MKVSKAATTVSKAANKVATVATKVAQKADAITKMSTDQIVSGVKSVATSVVKTVATTVKSAVNTVVSCAKSFYENKVQPALDVAVSFYNQHSDLIHTGLDIIGSLPIPYVSTIANGINAGLYLCEGNYIEAASAALNMLPGGGVIGKIKEVGETCINIANVGMSVKDGNYLGAAFGALSVLPIGNIMPKKASGIVDSGDELAEMAARNSDTEADAVADAGDDIAGACGKLGGCFVAGTLVLTPDGLVPIEEIEVGDTVIATDPETGETTEKTVEAVSETYDDELVHITVAGEEIVSTTHHPFYVPDKGWTGAVHLKVGDKLQLANGEYAEIEAIEREYLDEPVAVYNYVISDFHTYHVGKVGVLVHNGLPCPGKIGTPSSIGNGNSIVCCMKQTQVVENQEVHIGMPLTNNFMIK